MAAVPSAPAAPAANNASSRRAEPDAAARLDIAVEEAIAACDGDARAAVRALILANDFLEQELCEMFSAVSRGYARGRFKPRGASDDDDPNPDAQAS
jgi:hypothetical protein